MRARRHALLRCSLLAWVAVGGAGCLSRRPAPEPAQAAARVLPEEVAEAVEPFKAFDNRPYEFIWNPRPERPRPLVSFDQTLGWEVDATNRPVASFARTDEEQLWGAHVGKLGLGEGFAGGVVRVTPPEPLAVREHFDTVSLWVLPRFPEGSTDAASRPELAALVRDADGREVRVSLGALGWDGWRLLHRRMAKEEIAVMKQPGAWVGLEWSGLKPGAAAVYVDSLCLFSEHLEPLALPLRPKANLEMPSGSSLGLQAGEGVLPFPTRPETVMPLPASDALQNTVAEEGSDAFALSYALPEGTLTYRVACGPGAPSVSVWFREQEVGDVFAGGGIEGGSEIHGAMSISRREGDRVRIEYESGALYEVEMKGASLVLQASLRGGRGERFAPGRLAWQQPVQFLSLPALSVAGRPDMAEVGWAPLQEGAASGEALFVSRILDPYRSGCTEIVAGAGEGLGTAVYHPLTHGRRADLLERLVITVAPRLEEVLPTIPNPPARNGLALKDRLWVDPPTGAALREVGAWSARLGGMGITNLVMGHEEEVWQDVGENTTVRSRASQALGGDAALAQRLADLQALGWRVGLCANYQELSALSEHWSPDHIRRTSEGGLQIAPSGRYAVKIPAALTLQAALAPHWKTAFGPRLAYVGALTRDPPWVLPDLDERVPGAGRFAQDLYGIGELLLEESRRLEAPVLGHGAGALFYAGLADGLVAGDEDSGLLSAPYQPLFELYRVHPLCVRFGVGPLDPTTPPALRSAAVDRMLAAQVAYGRAGRLPPATWPAALQARAYYMMLAPQAQVAGRRPQRVAYWNGENYVSTSQAVGDGTAQRSLLYVLYDQGTEVWVNGSSRETWAVRVGRDTWQVPPYGWVVSDGGGLLSASALVGGHRVDFLRCADYLYWDGRGALSSFAKVSCDGPIVVRVREEREGWRLEALLPGGARRFGVGDVTGRNPILSEATLYGEGGQEFATVKTKADAGGLHWVHSETPVHRCVWSLQERQTEDL